ncbi:MAG TPA: hypothetical protein VII70_06850 [Steroidobacteraceae bacterium]
MRVAWLARIAVVLLMVSLSGCFLWHRHSGKNNTCNDPQIYMKAQSIPPLKTPIGLNAPDTKGALRIPDLNQPPPPPRTRTDPCLDSPPSYVVPKPAKPPQA